MAALVCYAFISCGYFNYCSQVYLCHHMQAPWPLKRCYTADDYSLYISRYNCWVLLHNLHWYSETNGNISVCANEVLNPPSGVAAQPFNSALIEAQGLVQLYPSSAYYYGNYL